MCFDLFICSITLYIYDTQIVLRDRRKKSIHSSMFDGAALDKGNQSCVLTDNSSMESYLYTVRYRLV